MRFVILMAKGNGISQMYHSTDTAFSERLGIRDKELGKVTRAMRRN